MCQSSVWLRHPDGNTEKIAEDVMIVRQDGPLVLFAGLFGQPMQITGTIQEVDAMHHTITLNVTETDQKPAPAHKPVGKPSQRIIDFPVHRRHKHEGE